MDVDELRTIFLFEGLTDEQLGDIVGAAEEVHFDDGDILFREGDHADFWWVLLEGRVELLRRTGHEETVVSSMERPGVWAGGFRAWSDAVGYLATSRGAGAGRMLRVPAPVLGERVRGWFPFGVHLIEGFFQTVRIMEAQSRQREALVALGTLAAGLAHEVNNPAAAASRAVDMLQDTCNALFDSLTALAQGNATAEQVIVLDELRRELDPLAPVTDSLALADREEALVTWIDEHDVDESWRIGPALAAAGADTAWCERVADVLDGALLGAGLDWVASSVSSTALLGEVKESTGRVSALVATVKSYTQLDRASVQLIDVTEGIDSTLVMLGHRLGEGITVVRDYAPDLPRIEANPGELNQVWTNLIDNAVDAMDGQGTLRVSTSDGGEMVVIEVADTGAGMPEEVRARAFEPFFTTKDVGKGTGLGLDISRRIVVERHEGEIDIASRPGETIFTIRLPVQGAAHA